MMVIGRNIFVYFKIYAHKASAKGGGPRSQLNYYFFNQYFMFSTEKYA